MHFLQSNCFGDEGGHLLTQQPEVDEALRLTRMSKYSLMEEEGTTRVQDPISAVYCAIRDDALKSGKQTYTWRDLVALLGRDFSVRRLASLPACKHLLPTHTRVLFVA